MRWRRMPTTSWCTRRGTARPRSRGWPSAAEAGGFAGAGGQGSGELRRLPALPASSAFACSRARSSPAARTGPATRSGRRRCACIDLLNRLRRDADTAELADILTPGRGAVLPPAALHQFRCLGPAPDHHLHRARAW
ncbi:MAG: hypothetical protein MZW92_64185 [Comamonadaceae bacterium]|nr:hypothetical protein [Comamonadaceae bacterium]